MAEDHPKEIPEQPEKQNTAGLIRSIERLAGLLALGGLVSFWAVSGLYESFYRRFGLSAPEMGIGYADTLIHSWGFIASLFSLTVISLATLWVTLRLTILFRARRNDTEEDAEYRLPPFLRTTLLGGWQYALVSAVLVAEIWIFADLALSDQVDKLATKAECGVAVEPIRFFDDWLMVDVFATDVTSIVPVAGVDATGVPVNQKLLYLGISDKSYVVYCASDHQIIYLSTERFVLTTASRSVSTDCKK